MQTEEALTMALEQMENSVRRGRTPEEAASTYLVFGFSNEDRDELLRRFRDRADRVRTLREPRSIVRSGRLSWYLGPADDDVFWSAYSNFLHKSGWDQEAIASLDASSTKVVSLLAHPGEGQIRTRGLVVGYVQSGKTANFTGVITKAADVGYRLFIVLSGLNNNLRNQTQLRLEKDIVSLTPQHWFSLTQETRDFSCSVGNVEYLLRGGAGQERVIGVIKKNPSRLLQLCVWLEGARSETLRSCPVLIIDDEADQATPNSHPRPEERTTINGLIVRLLSSLPKAAYIGYTATPFANFFIDPSDMVDLYPRDFIVDLPRSDNYFGPERIFGRDPIDGENPTEAETGIDVIRQVPEDEVSQLQPTQRDRHTFFPAITPSLTSALYWFFLTVAARRARGQGSKHNTMLIHTTQYVNVHNDMHGLLEGFRDAFLAKAESNDPEMLSFLEHEWEEETAKVEASAFGCPNTSFADLHDHLIPAINALTVIIENGQSANRLDYEGAAEGTGRTYIVVGGNVLSRGLTLEGLSVSYFIRSASAYDTLLQMGRWFGYRPGYADLARLWMTHELQNYFHDLATVEREMRAELTRYENGLYTPLEVGVRIRTHPHLAITARMKMQRAVHASMSFAERQVQTLRFYRKRRDWLTANFCAGQALIQALFADGLTPVSYQERPNKVFVGVPVARIREFLEAYKVHPVHVDMQDNYESLLKKYIEEENEKGRLTLWNVVVVTRVAMDLDLGKVDLGFPEELPLIRRSRDPARGAENEGDVKALMSQGDGMLDIDLPAEEMKAWASEDLPSKRRDYWPDRGVLLLYPIAKNSPPTRRSANRVAMDAEEHILGVALMFPKLGENVTDATVDYMTPDLSNVLQERLTDEDLENEDTH